MSHPTRWKAQMSFVGTTAAQAATCQSCSGPCALWDLLADNRFTRTRRHPNWYGPTERYRRHPRSEPNRFVRIRVPTDHNGWA